MESHADFETARALVGEDETLCGTLMPDGTPRYFVMPSDAEDRQVRAASFEVRNGRPMSEMEEFALSQAEAMRS